MAHFSGSSPSARWASLLLPIAAMAVVVLASNILVQYPFEPLGLADYLTWGAFSYPFAFLVTDLTNRHFGARDTRKVVYVGFVAAVILSAWFATPRIAIASGLAFLLAQLLDVEIFDRMRRRAWWMPPFLSSLVSSALDTVVFFTLAFSCSAVIGSSFGVIGITDACGADLPWTTWAVFDYLVKLALAITFIIPYGALRRVVSPVSVEPVESR
jgi:queuosine precursor transporter